MQVIAIFFIVAALGCAFTSIWGFFICFRIIGGLAVGASSVIAPMYISEISPAGLRGRLAGSFQVMIVTGIVVAYLTNYLFTQLQLADSWRWMLGVMVVPAVLFSMLLFGIPESPRWLILENNEAAALPILQRLGELNISRRGDLHPGFGERAPGEAFPAPVFQTDYLRHAAGHVQPAIRDQCHSILCAADLRTGGV